MTTQSPIPTSGVERYVMEVDFFEELAYLLIEYEVFEGVPAILSIRLCKKVAESGEIFYRPDEIPLDGPAYEAVWLFGVPGSNDLLSPRQVDCIFKRMCANEALPNIPEEKIIYAQPYHDKKKQMNLYRVVFNELHDVLVVATDPTKAFDKAYSYFVLRGYSSNKCGLKYIELIAAENADRNPLCL